MDETFIAARLAQLRMQKNVSARDMSLTMGQADNYINNIENGKSYPSMQGLFYICEYLKISPQEFFDEGSTSPALLNEVMGQLKSLDVKALEAILALAHELRRK